MVDRGEFFLKSYSINQVITIRFNGQTIQLSTDPIKLDKSEKLKIELNDLSETGTLLICGLNDKKVLLNLAIDIKNLLSLALGKRIIFDKQVYWSGEGSESIERQMSKNENEGEQIIPDFEIMNFLEKTLPKWTEYSKQEKDDIYTITDYLNQTKHDFIEDRILRTVQACECASNYWLKTVDLPIELL